MSSHSRNTFVGLIALIFVTIGWQSFYLSPQASFDSEFKDTGASGLYFDAYARFFYFHYYLNLFPVASEIPPTEYSLSGAEKLVRENGSSLLMEIDHSIRSGDRAKLFLFYPAAWLTGSPEHPSVVPAHALLFIVSLASLLAGAWYAHKILLGSLLVVFIGSNPFQLFEVYANENVFSWSISLVCLLLGVNFPVIFGRCQPKYLYFACALSGLLIGFAKHIRPEPQILVLPCLAVLLFQTSLKLRPRIIACAILLGTLLLSDRSMSFYFKNKIRIATSFVEHAGGNVFTDFNYDFHRVWHILYIGLSDYDTKYGHSIKDEYAYEQAARILNERSPGAYPWSGKHHLDKYYDSAKKYYVKFEDLPEYNELIGELFIADLKRDPLWYLEILLKRTWRILTETTPITIRVLNFKVALPFHGLLILPLALWLAAKKRTDELLLLLFSLSTSATAFLFWSAFNRTSYSTFHIFAAAIAITLICEGLFLRSNFIKNKFSSTSTH